MKFTEDQNFVVNNVGRTKLFISGPAGSGKTTSACSALEQLLLSGVQAESILVLTPQRSLAQPYREIVKKSDFPAGGLLSIVTLGGLAQRMDSLFWPMVAPLAGFKHPEHLPTFLTLETSQYYIARVVEPLIKNGYFDSITIDPNRAYSQILDNLNKSAIVGFQIDEIASRLKDAWTGRSKQLIAYDQVQECALLFRKYCLENNLLDFSLQLEIFARFLWPSTLCKSYLTQNYKHLIYDNIEEDIPVAHDIIQEWLSFFESALLIHDTTAGFRTFLGADDFSANKLAKGYQTIKFPGSFIQPKSVQLFEDTLIKSIREHSCLKTEDSEVLNAFSVHPFRFFPQALDWISEEISRLISNKNVLPQDIVVLTPFLSDSLRFALTQRFEKSQIPFSTFRPSRSLEDEPIVNAMLTMAKLAHPEWKLLPTKHDLRYSLMQIIPELDLIRADLLSQMLYSPSRQEGKLNSFSQIRSEMQERITFVIGNKYETIRNWLENSSTKNAELDIFISSFFGEILSSPDFIFYKNFQAASVVNRLIESARKFRQAVDLSVIPIDTSISKEFISMVENGVISAQYLSNWDVQIQTQGVLIAPAFTYLMSNRPGRYQFWLDVGSSGWWTRLEQPLTQPYVLSRNWKPGQKWTALDDLRTSDETLAKVCTGLLRRTSDHVYLLSINLNETGNEERGRLLVAIQTVLRSLPHKNEVENV